MTAVRALCCLPSVKKQKLFFVQCIIKKLLDSVFVISRIIKVEVRVISRSHRLRLITLSETLIILDITKTSSNNCLLTSGLYIKNKLRNTLHVFLNNHHIIAHKAVSNKNDK